MMSRAPGGRALAARPLAVLVASIQRTAGRAGDDSNRSADMDPPGFRTKHDSRYVRLPPQSLPGHPTDWRGELHCRGPGSFKSPKCFVLRGGLQAWGMA